MHHRTRVIRFILAVVVGASAPLLAACSSSPTSSPSSSPSSTSPVTSVESPDVVADSVPATGPGEPIAPTTAPEPDPAASTAACLEGMWVLPSDRTNTLLTSLLPGIPVTAEGSMSLEFRGDAVEHFVNVVVTFTVPNGSLSGPLDQRFAGTYSLEDGAALFEFDAVEGGWGSLAGTIGGVAVEVPVPPAELPPFGGGPVECTTDSLSIQYVSGLASSTAVWERAG